MRTAREAEDDAFVKVGFYAFLLANLTHFIDGGVHGQQDFTRGAPAETPL